LNTTDGPTKAVTESDVSEYLEKVSNDPEYFEPLDKDQGIDWIRADLVLERLFWDVA
jgi:hypothetical protein